MSGKTALIAGATGLVGSHLLNLLCDDVAFSKVKIITRKPLELSKEKVSEIVVDFDSLNQFSQRLTADVVFCCLGTTIKTAGSQDKFRKVDYTYCLELAKAGKAQGAKQFILVSSIGADAKSNNFYLRTKGEIENAIAALNFDSFCILRPSMLLGDRKESRIGESIGKVFMQATGFLLAGPLKKYKAIEAHTVARCMTTLAKDPEKGMMVFESDVIARYV
jgi:uncharacterized protein YbjT (DUF2867 family)